MARTTMRTITSTDSDCALTRKTFLRAGAAGAVAAAGAFACCGRAHAGEAPSVGFSSEPQVWDYEADIVIVGCGTSGTAASIEACDLGLDVLRIEKMDWEGGCGRRSGGAVFGGPTRVQRELGIEDNADDIFTFLQTVGEGWCEDDLLRTYADNCGETADWLLDLGMDMNWEYNDGVIGEDIEGTMGYGLVGPDAALNMSSAYGIDFVPRTHVPNPAPGYEGPQLFAAGFMDGLPGGTGLWKPLEEAVAAREMRTLYNTCLESLVLVARPDGTGAEVLGIRAAGSDGADVYVKARRGVVIATCCWFDNERLLRHFCHTRYVDRGYTGAWPGAHNGEGLIAAQAAGADLINMSLPGNTESMDGGLHVDPSMQVLNVFGEPIERLFAAGLVISGIKTTAGGGTPACGVHNGFALTSGRLAARSVAALEPREVQGANEA